MQYDTIRYRGSYVKIHVGSKTDEHQASLVNRTSSWKLNEK